MGDSVIKGRGLSPGKCEAKVALCDQFVSPLGEIGPEGAITGGLCAGLKFASKVLIFKGGRGSTVGSYIFLDLKMKGLGPAGIINESAEQMIVTGAIISDIPMVDSIPLDIFLPGDNVRIDGKTGEVEITNVVQKRIATAYLVNDERLLLMKRSDKVSTYPSQYGGVSGYIEKGEKPRETSAREIEEETGVTDAKFIKEGKEICVRSGSMLFLITPMIFSTRTEEVNLNWENAECEWIDFESLGNYETVPKFTETFLKLQSSDK